ncbi:hypothetical protein ACLOJK_014623, partial [Asimina triloba]
MPNSQRAVEHAQIFKSAARKKNHEDQRGTQPKAASQIFGSRPANAQIHQRSRKAAKRPIIRLEQGSAIPPELVAHQRHHHPIDVTQKPQFRTQPQKIVKTLRVPVKHENHGSDHHRLFESIKIGQRLTSANRRPASKTVNKYRNTHPIFK